MGKGKHLVYTPSSKATVLNNQLIESHLKSTSSTETKYDWKKPLKYNQVHQTVRNHALDSREGSNSIN